MNPDLEFIILFQDVRKYKVGLEGWAEIYMGPRE